MSYKFGFCVLFSFTISFKYMKVIYTYFGLIFMIYLTIFFFFVSKKV